MGLLFWRDNKELELFADKLAAEFRGVIPPGMPESQFDKKTRMRVSRAAENMTGKARDYRSHNRMGIYKKARIAQYFGNNLAQMEIHDDIVQRMRQQLLMALAG